MVVLALALLYGVLASAAEAQHEHPAAPSRATEPHDSGETHDAHGTLFPSWEASGTAWQPALTPMHGAGGSWGGWEVMLHGQLFAQLLYEPIDRHRTGGVARWQASSANWGMAMARRPLGAGRVGVRTMLTGEPWTVSDCGYLNLLATGEVCEGDTIHDRQHPHDLFMEVAADYDRPLRGALRWQVYGGLAGEPALGPGGFPHRASAAHNPVAPITHHWLDATHISFGLVTAGVYDRDWKAEVSVFNGREPDEHRGGFDLAPLDSFSLRLSLRPTDRLALQVSAGRLHEAEASLGAQPRTDVRRATASASYHRPWGETGLWATTIAYGVNWEREVVPEAVLDSATHAVMFESSVSPDERRTWFGRAEVVGKAAHDLHAHEFPTSIFTVGKLQVGYAHLLGSWSGVSARLGGTFSASVLPSELAPRYSGRLAPSVGVYLSVRPTRHAS